jgi:hypothetical protein
MGRHENLMKQHWAERQPAPLNLTDTQILDFLEKHFSGITRPGQVVLDIDEMTTRADSLREVACLAAAKIEEESK